MSPARTTDRTLHAEVTVFAEGILRAVFGRTTEDATRRVNYGEESRRRAELQQVPRRRDAHRRENNTEDRRRENHQQTKTRNRPEVRERDDNKPRSDDPDFALKCHILHRPIKAFHHFSNASTEKTPVSIDKMTKQLTMLIKPAVPNTQTSQLIEGNAKNWAHTTLVILRDHYEQVIRKQIGEMYKLETPEWQAPFGIASKWAKRHFGRRLTPETLTETEEIITVGLTRLQEQADTHTHTHTYTSEISAPRVSATRDLPRQGRGSAAATGLTTALLHAAATDGSPFTSDASTHSCPHNTRG
ncbi:uncharacterized protein LOC116378637 [Anarrhichthys ocellatus]|uniref:uncharacterized protein LOC116378637 n=1 Tax=Anarrhichthys ocellatus TaxID=433405 RepID=UPI0012EDE008|nr:uncharacterized protein LOC116378637 [Anarrhichthys ocellatus]